MTVDAKIKPKELVNKFDISNIVENYLTTKLTTFATKAELKAEQDKILKLQAFDSSYFHDKFFLVMMVFKICLFINQHLIHQLKKTMALIMFLV